MWNFDNCQEKEMVFGFTHHFSSSIASEDLAWLVTWSQRLIHAAAVHHATYFMCCGHWALIHMVSWWSSWAWGLNHLEFLCPEYCIISNKTICCSLASWPSNSPLLSDVIRCGFWITVKLSTKQKPWYWNGSITFYPAQHKACSTIFI